LRTRIALHRRTHEVREPAEHVRAGLGFSRSATVPAARGEGAIATAVATIVPPFIRAPSPVRTALRMAIMPSRTPKGLFRVLFQSLQTAENHVQFLFESSIRLCGRREGGNQQKAYEGDECELRHIANLNTEYSIGFRPLA